jgi:hypothetical protein
MMITLDEQIAEAERELTLRRKCYPAWVEAGRLTAEQRAAPTPRHVGDRNNAQEA